jgi:ATP-dependent RNA helicase MSS116
VQQSVTVCTQAAQPAELLGLLHQLAASKPRTPGTPPAPPHKVMVFFPTARLVQLYAAVVRRASESAAASAHHAARDDNGGLHIVEMHSRLSQAGRKRAASEFRTSSFVFLFSTDVSARGLDYPDVTAVVQVGVPSPSPSPSP